MELIQKNIIKLNSLDSDIELQYNLEFEDSYDNSFIFNQELYEISDKYKRMIDNVKNPRIWDFYKKLSNECELLHFTLKNKTQNVGVANYDPISRAFFKMWEICVDFKLLDSSSNKIIYSALAEGPGGFIECFNYYRRKYKPETELYNDVIKCISLRTTNNVPGWKKSNRIINECLNCEISYGADNTGDLYKKENIIEYAKLFDEQKADLASGDGGFDFSDDYANQEVNAFQLIFCELVAGMLTLRIGGNFVVKVFDIFNYCSIDMLYIMCKHFNEVIITKPHSSRTANSEKYIVCKGFKGITEDEKDNLLNIVEEINILIYQKKVIKRLLKNEIPTEFLDVITSCNLHFLSKQIKGILKILAIIEDKLSNDTINEIKKEQAVYATAWCEKYDFPINLRCRYLRDENPYNFIPNF